MFNAFTFLETQTNMSVMASAYRASLQTADLFDRVKITKDGRFAKGNSALDVDAFNQYGLTAREIDLIRAVGRENVMGENLYTGKSVRDAIINSDLDTQIALGKKLGISTKNLDTEKGLEEFGKKMGRKAFDLEDKIEKMLSDSSRRGTPLPGLREKSRLGKGARSSFERAFYQLLTEFKDTPLMQAYTFNELAKRIQRTSNKEISIMQAYMTPEMMKHVAVKLTMGVPLMLGADALRSSITGSESMYEMIENNTRGNRAFNSARVFSQINAVPFIGDAIAGFASPFYGDDFLSSFVGGGPTSDTIRDVFELGSHAAGFRGISLEQFLKKQVPNAIYIDAYKNDQHEKLLEHLRR